jgi:trimeric autotransporter adhesin
MTCFSALFAAGQPGVVPVSLSVSGCRRLAWLGAVLLLLVAPLSRAIAQVPVYLGTNIFHGSGGYQVNGLATVGGFKQFRAQAQVGGTGRIWEFSTLTSNYTDVWRPYSSGQTLAPLNQLINSTVDAASARYNSNGGGASGLLPTITAGRYYTFNIANSTGNAGTPGNSGYGNTMAVLETTYDPVNISGVSNPGGQAQGQSSTITATTAAAPNAAEYLWLRYSTDNFATSSLVLMTGSGATRTGVIPAQALGATVKYYVLSSNQNTGLTHANADMLTLRLLNNGNANYSFAVQLCGTYTVDPTGIGDRNYATLGAAFAALNTLGVFSACGGVTFGVKDGVTFPEQNLQLDAFANASNAPVVFQRDGSGAARPVVQPATSFSTGGTQDAIIKLNGADNLTFDGIDVAENPAATGANRMEYGYALFRASNANGCQNINVRNAAVTLNRANSNVTIGVYGALTDISGTAISPQTALAAVNRNVKLNGLTITSCYHGIFFNGGTGNGNADALLEFGTTAGNTLSALGDGALGDVYGIHAEGFCNLKVENNAITLNTTTASASAYGVGLGLLNLGAAGTSATTPFGGVLLNANTVQINSNSTANVAALWQRQLNVAGTTMTNNVVRNCALTGTTGTVQFLRDDSNSNNNLGATMTGNVIGGSPAAANTVASTGAVYGLYVSGAYNIGTGANELISNNEVSYNTFSGATGTLGIIQRDGLNNNTSALSFTNNRVLNNTVAKTGQTLGIAFNISGSKTLTMTGNTVQHNTFTGNSANVYAISGGLLDATGTTTISNNLVDDIQLTGTSVLFSGIRVYHAGTLLVSTNTVSNVALTNVGTGGTLNGIQCNGNHNVVGTLTFTNNLLTDLTLASTGAGTGSVLRGLNVENANAPGTTFVTSNTVRRLTLGAASTPNFGGEVRGITATSGAYTTATANRVGALTAYGTGSVTIGMHNIFITAGSLFDHNLIGDLHAPTANAGGARVVGLYYNTNTTSAGSVGRAYYNTIYLNATGGANFTTYGVYSAAGFLNTATATFDLRNNVVANTSAPGSAAGYTVAVGGQSGVALTGPANINAGSDYNVYYAGTPAARRLIYLDANAANVVSTLTGYQHLLADGRESHSRTGAVTFASTDVTNAAYLHLSTGAAQPAESAGQVIASEPTDIDGEPHFGAPGYAGTGTAPDAGADEGTFTPIDQTAPAILYTPLGAQLNGTLATLTATITDAGSSVATAAGTTRPRLYYKLSTNADVFNTNTSATLGWKWVEASGVGPSSFSFTLDYSLLPTAPAVGTTIQYFVVAQDNAPTPNVGAGPGLLFSTPPTSVALTASSFPLTLGTPYSFIIRGPIGGTVLVGPGQAYTSLTNAGGLFNAINTGVLTSDLTVLITGDLTAETGAITLNPAAESPTGANFSISIQPSAAVLRTITFTGGYMSLSGADRLTIDGRFNQSGTDQFLRLRGNTGSPIVWLRQDATYITLRNCVLEGAFSSGSYGTVYLGNSFQNADLGATGGVTGNSYFKLLNCDVRDRSDLMSTPGYGVVSVAGSVVANDNVTLSGNRFFNHLFGGINAIKAGASWTIGGPTRADGNVVYSTTTGTAAQTLISLDVTAAASGGLIQHNRLGGNAPDNSGTWTNSGGTVVGIYVAGLDVTPSTAAVTVRDNLVQNFALTSTGNTLFIGLQAAGRISSEFVNDTVRNATGAGAYSIFNGGVPVTLGTLTGIYSNQNGTAQVISGNVITGLRGTNTSTTATSVIGIAVTNGSGTLTRNRIWDLTTTNANAVTGLTGLFVFSGSPWLVTNNQLTLTNGTSPNPTILAGVVDWFNVGGTYAFNSVLLGGAATGGTAISYAYYRANTYATTLRNNLLLNTRTGGTGRHAVVMLSGAGSLTSNYNNLFAANPATVGLIGTTPYTFTTWKTTTGTPDLNSKNVPVKFVDEVTGNLNLDPTTNCALNNVGTPIAGINGEFDAATTNRQTTPDIGADEFAPVQQTASFVAASPTCGSGTATIAFTGNGGPWTVTYTDGTTPVTLTNQSTPTAALAVTAGKTYTISSVTDAYGCALTPGTPLVVNPIPTFVATAANAMCNGSNGTITFGSVTGGGPYQFQYRTGGNPFATGTVTGSGPYVLTVPPGTYDVRVLSATTCVSAVQTGLTITEPTLLTASASATPLAVCPGTTTTLTVTATGGTGALQYALNGGAYQSSNQFTGVGAGSYTVSVRDANLCVSAPVSVTIHTVMTTTWTGATSTDWYTATNWTACVPSATITAVIPTNATVVINSGTAAASDLTLQGTATLTISGTGNLSVFGALTLPAPGALVAQAGTVSFMATGAQTIPAAAYYNLAVTGATPKTLGGAVSVQHTLDLTNGLIEQGPNDLTMDDPAAGPLATIVGADAAHFLVQNGTGALRFARTGHGPTAHPSVTFPIGTIVGNALRYAPATLTFSANSTYVGAAQALVTNAVPGRAPSGSDVVRRTWDVSWGTGALPAGETATLALQWTTADEGATFDRSACSVAHFTGGVWTTGPFGAAVAVGPATWVRDWSGLTTFSPFAVQDADLPLPVELATFTATRQGTDALLAWTTASERNSKGFRVEVSTDGRTFRPLTFVASESPNSITARQYAFRDTEPGKAGTRYYRLRPVDLDGTTTSSAIVALAFVGGATAELHLFPNPLATGQAGTIELRSWPATTATIRVTDALGREVWHTVTPAATLTLPTGLPVGTYYVTATDETTTLSIRAVFVQQ